jgi:hypothetical protein
VAPLSKTKNFGPFLKTLSMNGTSFFFFSGITKMQNSPTSKLCPNTRALHGVQTCDNFFEKNSRDTQWVLVGYHEEKKQKMMVGFMKCETCNSMGISFFDKPMALRALITLDKHASINTKRVATRLYIYCSVHSRGCKLLPIELIIFNC